MKRVIIKQEVLSVLKDEEIWINELYRRLIKRGYSCSISTVYSVVKELEREKKIRIRKIGNLSLIKRI